MNLTHHILESSDSGVATVTLNSPARGNPLSPGLTAELYELLGVLNDDDYVRVIVLRGAGRHFCSGADLTGDLAAEARKIDASSIDINRLLDRLNTLRKPTVAVVHGACVGGGVALAACCDIIIGVENSFFLIPELSLGFPPAPMTPYFLQLFGWSLLRRYALTGERMSAGDAHRFGLLHRITDDATLEETLAHTVEALMRAAPAALGTYKEILAKNAFVPPAAFKMARAAGQNMVEVFESAEAKEGFSAFLEKRLPWWSR